MKKSVSQFEIKDAASGTVRAVIATLNVVDKDGDWTPNGAVTDGQAVVISAYGHKSWDGELPVGHGAISEVGNEVVFEGQFLLNTPQGQATFATVEELTKAGLQEWSYSLHDVESERAMKDGRSVRVLKRIGLIKEVSPVLRGAGVNTRTLQIKAEDDGETKQLASSLARLLRDAGRSRWGAEYPHWRYTWVDDYDVDAGTVVYEIEERDVAPRLVQVSFERTDTSVALGDDEVEVHRTAAYLPKGMKFSEHASEVLAEVRGLTARATEVVALRAEKGKSISAESGDLLKQVADALRGLETIGAPEPASDDVRARALALRIRASA